MVRRSRDLPGSAPSYATEAAQIGIRRETDPRTTRASPNPGGKVLLVRGTSAFAIRWALVSRQAVRG